MRTTISTDSVVNGKKPEEQPSKLLWSTTTHNSLTPSLFSVANVRLASGIVAAVLLVACHQSVDFNVLRAAKVNVRGMAPEGTDATVSVGEWGGVDQSAASDIGQRLRELVTNAPGGVVKFAESSGTVKLDGNLREYKYQDSVTTKDDTCQKWDAGSKKNVDYSCKRYTRSGEARISVSMNVIDLTGKTVGSDSFTASKPVEVTATDEEPAAIPWDDIMVSLRAQSAEKLAGLVVPRPVVVQKRWFSCGDAKDTCEAGLAQLRHGNFEQAQAQFLRAVESLKSAAKPDPESLAAAWWALTLSQEFSGDFQGAKSSLDQAVALDPSNEIYAAESQSLADEKANADKLAKQGLASK